MSAARYHFAKDIDSLVAGVNALLQAQNEWVNNENH